MKQRRILRGGWFDVTSLLPVANSSFQSLSFRGKGGVFTGEFTPSCLLCQEGSALGILDRDELFMYLIVRPDRLALMHFCPALQARWTGWMASSPAASGTNTSSLVITATAGTATLPGGNRTKPVRCSSQTGPMLTTKLSLCNVYISTIRPQQKV